MVVDDISLDRSQGDGGVAGTRGTEVPESNPSFKPDRQFAC